VLLSLVLQACAENPNYAPVTTNSQNIPANEQNSIENKPDIKISENKPPEPSKPPQTIINTTEPAPYAAPPSTEKAKYHTVKKNETLYSISANSGHDYQQLAKWNNISAPYTVEVGQKIKLFVNNALPVYNKNLAKQEYKTEINHKKTKKPFISISNNKPSHSGSKARKTRRSRNPTKSQSLKTATISIDNKKMLKLAFQWPLKGVVVKNFRQSKNKGIDIAGKIGQTVSAAEAGKVIYGGPWLVGFGNLLIIKHNPIYLSAYANNSHLFVKEGQNVQKGQVVAQVGRTPSRKAALHFEIRKNGKSVNPLRLLPSL
jgi:lipoprotein NlpD